MRILHLVLRMDPGGAEQLVLDLVRHAPADFEPEVCCLDERGLWGEELQASGVPVHLTGRAPGFQPRLVGRIRALLRERRIDVLHCHQYTPFVYGALATFGRRSCRLVFTEHGRLDDSPPSGKRRLANRLLGRIAGHHFAVCEDLRGHMIAEGFRPARLGVIYNGIALGSVPSAAERERARAALGLDGSAAVVGTVARLNHVKDLTTLVHALQDSEAHLVIVGEGPERARIEELAGDRVHLLGYRDDVRQLLPAFDLFVNCSLQEGVSLTIVEAMASALPVVATAVGGTPEVVEGGVTGLLVPPSDPATLRTAIDTILADRERAADMGSAGRKRAEDHFGLETMLDRYGTVYRGSKGA